MDRPIKIDEWVVVIAGLGVQFLGRIAADEARGWSAAAYVRALADGRDVPVRLDVAFELATPMVAAGEGKHRRMAQVLPIGLAAHPIPITVRGIAAYACAEMHDDDKRAYASIVEQGLTMLAGASRSGGEGGLPPGGLGKSRSPIIMPGT